MFGSSYKVGSSMKEKDAIKAFLGDDTEFEGQLHFEGTVRIDGRFKGEISTDDTLIVGEHADVQAEIHVGSLMVQGKVEGNVVATKKLHITSKGKLIGNITSPVLHIEEGAILEGTVTMIDRGDGSKALPRKGFSTDDTQVKEPASGENSAPRAKVVQKQISDD
jgi:cytoskeletal protein CcmA (bactofilin family)